MPRPLLIFSQSGYLIQIVVINLHTWWQTVQIQISWLLQKPTDLDLHCLQNRIYPGSAGQGLIYSVRCLPPWGASNEYPQQTLLQRNRKKYTRIIAKYASLRSPGLTRFSLETPKRVINKQCRPRSDTTFRIFTVCKQLSHFFAGNI